MHVQLHLAVSTRDGGDRELKLLTLSLCGWDNLCDSIACSLRLRRRCVGVGVRFTVVNDAARTTSTRA